MVERTTVYKGFCSVELVNLGNGPREVVRTSNSVACLFYLPNRQQVVLVRQQREAAVCDQYPEGWVIEPCAGRFDVALGVKGLVVQEAREELGVTLEESEIVLLNNGQPLFLSCGILTERKYLAFAEISDNAIEAEERTFGVDEGEHITRVWLTVDEFRTHRCDCISVFALQQWFFNNIKEM